MGLNLDVSFAHPYVGSVFVSGGAVQCKCCMHRMDGSKGVRPCCMPLIYAAKILATTDACDRLIRGDMERNREVLLLHDTEL